jgi:Etoposide-induced protein 2.4 (EI24)
LLTLPLWLVPPLALVLPVLVCGWLSARVLSYGSLAVHADGDERRALCRLHRWPLLAMGLIASALGLAPTLLGLLGGVASVVFAPLLVVVGAWIYTGVFAFATLWFAHFMLAQLQALRAGAVSSIGAAVADPGPALQPQNSGTAP